MTGLTLNIPIPPSVLWIFLLIALVIFATSLWVLFHHWGYYGIKNNNKVFVRSLYFIISIIVLLSMLLLAGSYQTL